MNYVKTGMLLAAMTALFLGVGYMLGGPGGAMIAFVVALGMNAFAFWNSGSMALRMHGARQVDRTSAPKLFDMVEELSRNAQLPTPSVYIIESDQPNAFATGRSPEQGAVAVTTGIMRMLSHEELAGVVAHELAHIKNRDTLIMTVAATVAGAISMLANFGMFFGGASNNERNPFGFIGVLVAVILAPMAAAMIQMMISRTREYAADRLGAEICGHPLWLASALAKISGQAAHREMHSAERNPASAHLFIVNPLSGRRMDNLFSTHPNTQNRIDALYEMAADRGGAPSVRRNRRGAISRGAASYKGRPARFSQSAPQKGERSNAPRAGKRSTPRKGPWG